jgi:hypothetical protein
VWTVKESSPTSPMWFCSFQDHLHFWKNWITDPVAMQRHNNRDPFPGKVFTAPFLLLCCGTTIPTRFGNVVSSFGGPLPRERVYGVVSSGTCVPSRCPGNLLNVRLHSLYNFSADRLGVYDSGQGCSQACPSNAYPTGTQPISREPSPTGT